MNSRQYEFGTEREEKELVANVITSFAILHEQESQEYGDLFLTPAQ